MKTKSNTKKVSKKPKRKTLNKPVVSSSASLGLNDGDALEGCSSISDWENRNGRGFWGSSANGYIYDKDL